MTEVNEAETAPENATDNAVESPGSLVRAKRESAGLSLAAVAQALHLTVHYVKSLENDEYSKLPGMTFVKGYFRSYARYLNMDVDSVLDAYEGYVRQLGELDEREEQSYRIRHRNDQVLVWAVVAGIILVLGLAAGWWFVGRDDVARSGTTVRQTQPAMTLPPQQEARRALPEPEPPAAMSAEVDTAATMDAAEPAPALDDAAVVAPDETVSLGGEPVPFEQAAAEAAPALPETEAGETTSPPTAEGEDALEESTPPNDTGEPVAASPVVETVTLAESGTRSIELLGDGADALRMNFSGTSWVEVDDAAMTRLYNDLMRSGDELFVRADSPFYILLGDATQVEILINEEPINLAPRIRTDKTARFELGDLGARRWAVQ